MRKVSRREFTKNRLQSLYCTVEQLLWTFANVSRSKMNEQRHLRHLTWFVSTSRRRIRLMFDRWRVMANNIRLFDLPNRLCVRSVQQYGWTRRQSAVSSNWKSIKVLLVWYTLCIWFSESGLCGETMKLACYSTRLGIRYTLGTTSGTE